MKVSCGKSRKPNNNKAGQQQRAWKRKRESEQVEGPGDRGLWDSLQYAEAPILFILLFLWPAIAPLHVAGRTTSECNQLIKGQHAELNKQTKNEYNNEKKKKFMPN